MDKVVLYLNKVWEDLQMLRALWGQRQMAIKADKAMRTWRKPDFWQRLAA